MRQQEPSEELAWGGGTPPASPQPLRIRSHENASSRAPTWSTHPGSLMGRAAPHSGSVRPPPLGGCVLAHSLRAGFRWDASSLVRSL